VIILLVIVIGSSLVLSALIGWAFIRQGRHASAFTKAVLSRPLVGISIALNLSGVVLSTIAGLSSGVAPFISRKEVHNMTIVGAVSTYNGWAVVYPTPNQSITTPTPVMMKALPAVGTTQDHIDAAASYFSQHPGRYSLTGDLLPFGQTHIFAIDHVANQ
jgi:hypothetical protein